MELSFNYIPIHIYYVLGCPERISLTGFEDNSINGLYEFKGIVLEPEGREVYQAENGLDKCISYVGYWRVGDCSDRPGDNIGLLTKTYAWSEQVNHRCPTDLPQEWNRWKYDKVLGIRFPDAIVEAAGNIFT